MALSPKYAELARLQSENERDLFTRRNVVGVGIGEKAFQGNDHPEPCLTLFVSEKLPMAELSEDDRIPRAFGRYRTDVVLSGAWYPAALPMPPKEEIPGSLSAEVEPPGLLTARIRPALGGYSVGNKGLQVGNQKYAGTIGAMVFDAAGSYLLSNNHVLAVLNKEPEGSPILQPGPGDGGRAPADTIGSLARYIPLRFGLNDQNTVDAALASVSPDVLSPEIYKIGMLQGTAEAEIGMKVQKTGRTSGHTTGEVLNVNFSFSLTYLNHQTANFTEQILTTPMQSVGDSGSVLCTMDGKAVGLLLGYSGTLTVHNRIQNIEELLGVSVVPPA